MALYDNYTGNEQRLRFDASNRVPLLNAPIEYGITPANASGELSPNFIGGDVDTTTGNLNPGTRQKASKGVKVTPLPTPNTTPGAPVSRLSQV